MTLKWTRKPPTTRGLWWVAWRHRNPPAKGRMFMQGYHDKYTAAVANVFGPIGEHRYRPVLHISFEGLVCAFPVEYGRVCDYDVWYGMEPIAMPEVPSVKKPKKRSPR